MSIGKQLLHLRKAKGLSQEEFAASLNVSRQTVSKWESDLSLPGMDSIVKISEFYKVSINSLLEINEENKTDHTDILLEKIEQLSKTNKKHFMIEIILSICLIISCGWLVYLKQQPTQIINQNYETNHEIAPFVSECTLKDLDMANFKIKALISLTFNQYQESDLVEYIFKNENGEQRCTLHYVGDGVFETEEWIKIADYEEQFVIVNHEQRYPAYTNNFLYEFSERMNECVNLYVPKVDDKYQKNIIKYSPENKNMTGKLHVQLGYVAQLGSELNFFVDEVIDMNQEKVFELEEELKTNKDLSVWLHVVVDGEEYEIYNNSIKLFFPTGIDNDYSLK